MSERDDSEALARVMNEGYDMGLSRVADMLADPETVDAVAIAVRRGGYDARRPGQSRNEARAAAVLGLLRERVIP